MVGKPISGEVLEFLAVAVQAILFTQDVYPACKHSLRSLSAGPARTKPLLNPTAVSPF